VIGSARGGARIRHRGAALLLCAALVAAPLAALLHTHHGRSAISLVGASPPHADSEGVPHAADLERPCAVCAHLAAGARAGLAPAAPDPVWQRVGHTLSCVTGPSSPPALPLVGVPRYRGPPSIEA
jgi:hypothetical protein